MDSRANCFPGHGSCPLESDLNGLQDRSIPVSLQATPATFNRIIFAVVGRIVDEANFEARGIGTLNHALQELGSLPGNLGAVVEVEDQFLEMRIESTTLFPPPFLAMTDLGEV